MKFVADEGVDAPIVALLREQGFDVIYIAEVAAGSPDDIILAYANEEERVLITRDKDFGELVFREQKVHTGIILNRLYELSIEEKAKLVLEVIQEFGDELLGSFTVIQPGKVRIKKM